MGDYITIVSDATGGNVAYAATFNLEEDIYFVRVTPAASNLALLSAESVLGGFGINLPLTGASGVECRSGGSQSNYVVDFIFNNNLSSVASVTTSCGTIVSSMIDGTDSHRYIVNLSAPSCNAEDVTVTLHNVTDNQTNTLTAAPVTMGLLLGDVDGDRTVTTTDFNLTKADNGHSADETNFREDINSNGKIDRRDAKVVRQQRGTSLP
jgi:hypothetical protein